MVFVMGGVGMRMRVVIVIAMEMKMVMEMSVEMMVCVRTRHATCVGYGGHSLNVTHRHEYCDEEDTQRASSSPDRMKRLMQLEPLAAANDLSIHVDCSISPCRRDGTCAQ